MTRWVLVFVLSFALVETTPGVDELRALWGEPSASVETTPAGLAYHLIHMPDEEEVAIWVAWPTDWAYTAGRNQAVPHVGWELLLAGGAEGYAPGTATERFSDLDSYGDLVVTPDHILGSLSFDAKHLPETVEIANAVLRAPSFDEAWLARIKDGLEARISEAAAQPSFRGFDAVRWAVFGDQPLRGALSLDVPDAIKSVEVSDVRAWHEEVFTRSNLTIVVAGGIHPDIVGIAIDDVLKGLPETGRAMNRRVEADFSPRRILLHLPDTEVSWLSFIAPLPPTREGGEAEDLIITHALGGDDQSVLFEAVRNEARAAYDFHAGFANYTRELRILFMSGAVETGKLEEVSLAVLKAYAGLRDAGPAGDLDARKAPLRANIERNRDIADTMAFSGLQGALDGSGVERVLRFAEELDGVSAESIRTRLAASWPASDAFVVIAVSPERNALSGACVITHPRQAASCP